MFFGMGSETIKINGTLCILDGGGARKQMEMHGNHTESTQNGGEAWGTGGQ